VLDGKASTSIEVVLLTEGNERRTEIARTSTDAEGRFSVRTIQPGPVDDQAPHVCVQIFMRGLLRPVHTRVYFPAHPKLMQDPVLALVPATRRATLIARRAGEDVLEWDVRMQGDGETETVFFDF